MEIWYCPEPKEIMYQGVKYKNIEAVQGLLKFYFQLKEGNIYKPNFELVAILLDVEDAITHCEFTDRQKEVLDLYMGGLTEVEIATELSTSQPNISKHVKSICKKVSSYLTGGK